jgi:transposase
MNVLIADKDYNANYSIKKAESICVKTVIPPRSMRNNPRIYDKDLYKYRNLIERMFNNVKQFRRAITRYDKLDLSYRGERK